DVVVDLDAMLECMSPAILKIAYELAYYWLGQDYLLTKTARGIRDFFYSFLYLEDYESNSVWPTHTNIYYNTDGEISNSHTATLKVEDDKIVCEINLFNFIVANITVCETLPPTGVLENKTMTIFI
ncbi:MAG: hypothetical protein QJR05_14335, partial [Thermoanaerobacterium sp.]|nr:hypothetical protein [Thermoanaerobacterium sp.]